MLISVNGLSQLAIFPDKGQLPTNAFPVCGIDTFRQLIVPYGYGGKIDIPGCGLLDVLNPYYYSFTCYSAGTLALLVNPVSDEQDYNWELFDITGHNPNDIFTDNSLAVIGNWSGSYGRTGARLNGIPSTQCISSPVDSDSTFSEMPALIQGHQYLLLVSGYSKSQSGYQLAFAGRTAIITDPKFPHLQSAYLGCDKKIINVVVNKQIRCMSLAADGSDFRINSGTVSITGALGINCNSQFDLDTLQLTLSAEIAPGNYLLSTRIGSDGNTLMDNCGKLVPTDENISFSALMTDTVSADFSYQIGYGCRQDTLFIKYPLVNGVNHWQWWIDTLIDSSEFEPTITKSVFEPFQVTHTVSNGFCYDTVTKIISLDNALKAEFQSPSEVCPQDMVAFSDLSMGNIVSWQWNFGDGTSSNQQKPPAHLFPDSRSEKKYIVSLIVGNNLGCYDTVNTSLTKLQSCYITVPNAFTPDGDGKNDYLYPLNGFLATSLLFRVFNRFGQIVFETRDWTRKWDGSINGIPQAFGTYIWMLNYTDGLSGKKFSLRGTSILIR